MFVHINMHSIIVPINKGMDGGGEKNKGMDEQR